MTQMTPGQARIVDPVLSTIAHGYSSPDISRVGRILFPRVSLNSRGAQVLKFGKEDFRLYNTRRAPGASTKRVQFGYEAGAMSLTQESLEGLVPFELMGEASQLPGVDLARDAVENVQEIFDRAEEYEQIKVATDASNYDANHKIALSGGDMWSDPTAAVDEQVKEYRNAVRASIGRKPNVLVIAPNVFDALSSNEGIKDRFKYTSSASATIAMLQEYFSIPNIVVAEDIFMADGDADDADFTDMMSGQAVLAYVPQGARYNVPSFGYTYHLKGHPMVEQPYQDRNRKSWIYPQTYERQVVQTGEGAGFLIQNIVAAE